MVAVSMATKSTLTVCLCFLSNLNGPYWSCCPSQTALIEYCFHRDPNQGYDASCLHTLGGSGWWGREWHDKCPASVGKHFAAARECVPLSKVVGYRTTKRTMQCRQSTLTPSPTPHYGPCALRFPSAMHQVDASSKKLWLFFFSRILVLYSYCAASVCYSPCLALRSIWWQKARRIICPSPLSSHTHNATCPQRKNWKRANMHTKSTECIHIKQDFIPDDQTSIHTKLYYNNLLNTFIKDIRKYKKKTKSKLTRCIRHAPAHPIETITVLADYRAEVPWLPLQGQRKA